jgi:predicted metal-dependent enzyme (double-stranded beta helix superfamily)
MAETHTGENWDKRILFPHRPCTSTPMTHHNWLVTDDGQYRAFGNPNIPVPGRYYRLYRFLTELEDILETFHDDFSRLEAVTPLVRKLLLSSYWLQRDYQIPSPEKGWTVHDLYREQDFPLTLQMTTGLPGHRSTIHNHGTWGIIALVEGQEQHRLWQHQPHSDQPDHLTLTHELTLKPGDVIALTANAIHSVEPLGDRPTVSFNLYGEARFIPRYEFDPDSPGAKPL